MSRRHDRDKSPRCGETRSNEELPMDNAHFARHETLYVRMKPPLSREKEECQFYGRRKRRKDDEETRKTKALFIFESVISRSKTKQASIKLRSHREKLHERN